MDGHVLHVVTDTDRRGAQTFALDLGRALEALGVRGRTVALRPGRGRHRLEVPTLGQHPLGAATLARLRSEMRVADVVVAHGSTTLPACAVAGSGLATPFVYRNIGDPLFWARDARRRRRVRRLLARSAAVAALWPGSAEVLTTTLGVPPHRVVVVPNGVPAERCPVSRPAERPARRAAMGLESGVPAAAAVGSLTAEKDIGSAIAAVARTGIQLILAGDGPLRAELEQQAAREAPGRVHFLGVVDDPADVFAAADLALLTSHSEGMPGVLIEAGLCGLGAVTTDVGAVREVVRDGETGEVAAGREPGHLAAAIVRATERSDRYGAAARDRCLEHFEIGPVARRWQQLLEQAVTGLRPAGSLMTSPAPRP